MSTDIPDMQAANNQKIASHGRESPQSPAHNKFLLPSPIPTRRNRTYSQSERALKSMSYKGKVKSFCREKGHGFIVREDNKEIMFVHISDIEGEYVPKENDDVSFKLVPMPLNPAKQQAVHVKITHLAPGVSHETWSSCASHPVSGSPR
ncbi:calcium-regulated heat-stable protein 1-like [Mya arenaria]|nr:calcium-regulated heat-stable protein 1-like [Mya arenaria]XP_052774312.1 calcium-regulated heat-stable protein 1-like [Mya arenaria]